MGKHSAPDPDGIEALTEAVNEVYRDIAQGIPPGVLDYLDRAERVPDASPQAIRALVAIQSYVALRGRPRPPLRLVVNAEEAGEVLSLVVGLAFAHQADNHPEEGWAACRSIAEEVYYACRLFVAAFEGASR